MSMIIESNSNQLIDFIRGKIFSGEFASGSKIPPLRELMKRYDLTQSTARSAVMSLVDNGLLEARHGSGFYVRERSSLLGTGNAETRTIAFLLFTRDITSNYSSRALIGAHQAAIDNNCSLQTYYKPYMEVTSEYLEDISERSSGLIMAGIYDMYLSEFKLKCPAVGIAMHDNQLGRFSLVEIDPFVASGLAERFFQEHGVDKVNVVFNSRCPAQNIRGEIFARYWSRRGGECEIIEEGSSIDFSNSEGYFFGTGHAFNDYSQLYRKLKNEDLTHDIPAILEYDGVTRIVDSYDKCSSISVNWENVGCSALIECLRMINCPGVPTRRIYISPQFIEFKHNKE